MIKGIMKEIDAILALLAVEIYSLLGMPAGNIAMQIKRQFKVKAKRIPEDINGLIVLMHKAGYVDSLQGAELKIQGENQKLREGVASVLNEKVEGIEIMKERLNAAIGMLSVFMLIVPVGMGVSLILGMMISTSNLMNH
jgi:uncharacterized membrane protein